ncbi:30S ribosomal protein S6 [Enterobacteriaceae endosymbiont of Plateumaris consimilis]|uniref:30S ribosomal protein S6 n=1 Tax=Enterobacteriaceae endosymbiont of Plateumaris consimilis TaxID=2675794 RepID=UPI001449CEA8|nr:30S ribosomal protein S6 [Enterobacteriaceae endosymbiont of Plateumaris consimilis]QJC28739.1 30S ribosomal protein S6 [Enterobacteriaceae endosymbiont of Plateumaris consimilis]
MRYYEIILIIHPDQSDQIEDILKYYKSIIDQNKGIISRLENWGRRQLSYPINKLHKAHYILMNIMINNNYINNLEKNFFLNESIIRYIVIKTKKEIKCMSPILKSKDEHTEEKSNDIIKTI